MLIIIILLVLLILLMAGGAAYYMLVLKDNGGVQEKPIIKTTLDQFTVNLADGNFRRYVRMTLTLEYTEKKLTKELEEKKHRLRDVVISLLMTKRVSDMSDHTIIRQELEDAINSVLTKGQITGIYFEDFIIQ